MNKFNIIINADDLGTSHKVNVAIEQALAGGFISSSTIMANSDSLDEVLRITRKYTNASFGVHLNLTEGKSITNIKVLFDYGIIDVDGCFKESNRELIPNVLCDELKIAIKEEWNAQIKKLIDFGIILSHIDGHHHCNSWKGLEDVVIAVAKENNIPKVRNDFFVPKEVNVKHSVLRIVSKCLKPIEKPTGTYLIDKIYKYQQMEDVINEYGQMMKDNGVKTPYAFMSYSQLVEFLSKYHNYIFHNCYIELMCHPGHPHYQSETDMILSDSLGIKRNSKYKLISYKEL